MSKMKERRLSFILFSTLFLVHFLSCGATITDEEEDANYGYDYYESYYSSKEFSNISNEDSSSASKANGPHMVGGEISEDKFNVSCTESDIKLIIHQNAIPRGLKLYSHQKIGSSATTCQRYREEHTTMTYSVDRSCGHLVTTKQIGTKVFYHHKVLLVPEAMTASAYTPFSALYTIVMECEASGHFDQNNTNTSNTRFRTERKIFEHRFSGSESTCERSVCPYENLCLRQNEIDGFYCICASKGHCNLQCPTGYYACDRPGTNQHLQCISNGWLCDKRHDCPLKDDEASCTEIWSVWGPWSQCGGRCGEKTQRRSRTCDISFERDPERCKLYRSALGCSRTCTTKQSETEDRSCGDKRCSRVTCDRHHMTVEIPREPDMTAQAIREHMTMGRDRRCRPTYNETHVLFQTLLHKCNTVSKMEGDVIIYSNEIHYRVETDPSSVVIRDLSHSYSVMCRFNRRRKVTLRKNHRKRNNDNKLAVLSFDHRNTSNHNKAQKWSNMNEDNLIEHSASGEGEFEFKMDLYEDESYLEAYSTSSYPLFKKLHEDLYVGIHFQTVDEDLTLMIDRCIATPTTSNDQSAEQYVFVEKGCPSDETVKMYINDVSPKNACFSIETFKFVDSSKPYVYFQCDVLVCGVDDDYCRPNCSEHRQDEINSRKKRSSPYGIFPHDEELIRGHVIQGPIVIKADVDQQRASNGGLMVHRRISLSEDYLDLSVGHDPSKTINVSSAKSYIIIGAIGGVSCLIVGVLAGVLVSRKLKTTLTAV